VSKKKNGAFVIPDATGRSTGAIALCELFVTQIFDTADPSVEFEVDVKKSMVVSANRPIKELISMYLKSGRLALFYQQLQSLAWNDAASGKSVLKLVLEDETVLIGLEELRGLPDLRLRVSKLQAGDAKP
jgi:hypothetical protein